MEKEFRWGEEDTELEELIPDPEEDDFELLIPEYDWVQEYYRCGAAEEGRDWNVSVTENGAVGYCTSGYALLDLNFMAASLRGCHESYIVKEFVKAYYESPEYAVKWLFFLRDISEGLGERRTFRICMKYLAESHPQIASAVMELIPEYGRFDDLLLFLDTDLRGKVCSCLKSLLDQDLLAMQENRPVSLLAKWLPSINTSSGETRRQAQILSRQLGMRSREYRKTLSGLRAYGNVLEVKLSASRWDEIRYEAVPAKANLKYQQAFWRHDRERREAYLRSVLEGDAKLNSRGIMPCEVVHRFLKGQYCGCTLKDDIFAELMWEQLVRQGFQNEWGLKDCIVVADGSGSMYNYAGGSSGFMAIEICDALAIYFAEQLRGIFHNKVITFSGHPRFIDLEKGKTLKEKLEIMLAYNEIANTNVEAVFDLLLNLAVSGNVPAEELPGQVLIISDMEFDQAAAFRDWGSEEQSRKEFSPPLFNVIEKRYKAAGYQMPRLIFWNVCGRTNTIPKVENENGLCLLSGFSQNAARITADEAETDPYESLIRVLDGSRYRKVSEAIAGLTA